MNVEKKARDVDSRSEWEVEPFNKAIGERLRYIRTDVLNLSVANMAKRFDVGTSTIQRYESGERTADALFIAKVADASDMDERWILRGGDELQRQTSTSMTTTGITDVLGNAVDTGEFIFVPRYNVTAAAGYGAWNDDETPMYTVSFRRYWVTHYLRTDPRNLSVISVYGDSMEGVLNDKDVILINHEDRDPREGIYVLRIDGQLLVKRVQRLPGGQLYVSSTNPAYQPFTINLATLPDDFDIIGKVVWYGRVM
ncbi:XRE family transcriptional regulator [Citrobacter amalonaticus]|uniref:DNA-binding helix-turn-helix protein n=2 Tax=Enterobacteriaceae TaxID=543 RepID=A0AAX2BEG3_CITAM|nr:helix-turn-helix transcriptional regulator [Citrobacter amalonaticus]SAZ04039.1 DNA-binding helix-turn-helix protein [Citrobacter amalonaticus]